MFYNYSLYIDWLWITIVVYLKGISFFGIIFVSGCIMRIRYMHSCSVQSLTGRFKNIHQIARNLCGPAINRLNMEIIFYHANPIARALCLLSGYSNIARFPTCPHIQNIYILVHVCNRRLWSSRRVVKCFWEGMIFDSIPRIVVNNHKR